MLSFIHEHYFLDSLCNCFVSCMANLNLLPQDWSQIERISADKCCMAILIFTLKLIVFLCRPIVKAILKIKLYVKAH